MVSTIRYSANALSNHYPNQVPGILIIMNPKQPNLPTCSVTSTYLLFHLLSNPSLHLIANTTLGIIMTAIKISPKTLNHSILSTITNSDWTKSLRDGLPRLWHSDFLFSVTKSSGKQVLKVVLLNHHKITIKQDRPLHCLWKEYHPSTWLASGFMTPMPLRIKQCFW